MYVLSAYFLVHTAHFLMKVTLGLFVNLRSFVSLEGCFGHIHLCEYAKKHLVNLEHQTLHCGLPSFN